jgi:hypothetical protein
MTLLKRVRRALEPTFAVERELGAGGMGIVFEAHDTRLERKVAVKVLRPESATAVAAHRFLREARMLARLKHPNVVQVHQAGEGDGLYWFVMDLVQGETLASRLARGPLSEKETVSLARELLSALAVAHEHGIVHRDIKPANIFLENGHALLADFGIARTTTTSDSESGITATKEVIGTPAYMAPEQMTGEVAGPAADQYSLALVMYECLTGKRWPALQTASSGDWRPVPSALAPVIRRAIASSPAERWPDVRAMSAALIPHRPRWPLLAAAAAAAAAVVVWVLSRPSSSEAGPYEPGAVIPTSRAGLQAWNQAEALYFRGAWREADTAYRRALARDSGCLACEFRLIDVDRWLERRRDSGRIARLSAGLPRFSEPWGRLVAATLAPASRRVELLADLTTDYREWPLAWYYRGAELFNRGSLFGHGWNEANDALTTLARLDSSFVLSWTDLTLIRIALGDSGGADSALRRLQALPPADGLAQAQRLMAALAFEFRFTPNGLALWQNVSRAPELAGMPEVGAGPRVLSGLGTPLGGVLGRAFERRAEAAAAFRPHRRNAGERGAGRIDSAARRSPAQHHLPSHQLLAFGAMLDAANVLSTTPVLIRRRAGRGHADAVYAGDHAAPGAPRRGLAHRACGDPTPRSGRGPCHVPDARR